MAERFQRAVRALNQGRLEIAAGLCRELLKEQPANVDATHLLGVILFESGQAEEGEALLKQAIRERPDDAEIYYNYASAALKNERYQQALMLFERALALNPRHLSALNNRGTALKQLGQKQEARASYRQALELRADNPSVLFNLANLDQEEGNAAEAESGYRRALAINPAYAEARISLASLLLDQGRCSAAVGIIEPAVRARPDLADGWRTLGRALAGVNRFGEGRDAALRATELAPESADAWNSYAAAEISLGDLASGETALERALKLDPEHRLAWVNKASLMELSNRLPECEQATSEGLQRWPGDPVLLLLRARMLRRSGDHEAAAQILEELLERGLAGQQLRELHFEMGQIQDRLGQASSAFAHYLEGNRLAAEAWRAGDPDQDRYLVAVDELSATFNEGFVRMWVADEAPESLPTPAFLVGFQRSGTTLLDTMLGAHPAIRVMEELPVINSLIDVLVKKYGPYPRVLASLDAVALEDLRGIYWRKASELSGIDAPGEFLLLDKSPLNSVHAGLIKRLFPNAQIIFALRHPLDVVLSCFMQDFTMSSFMLNYTSVEGVAKVYVQVMDLWFKYRQLLDLRTRQVRYEDLVDDPEAQMRELLGFLDLPWDDGVLAHSAHARSRGLINTPSYHQVTEPVYRRARNRWRNYRAQLEPVIPVLSPYIKTFGYEVP